MRIRHQTVMFTLLGLLGVLLFAAPVAFAQDVSVAQDTCPAFIDQALAQVGNNCANLNGSFACYGSGDVSATLNQDSQVQFSQPSDRLSLDLISGLRTEGFDAATGNVGIALLNVIANSAASDGALVGDVKYVLFGDVEVLNAVESDNMFLLPELAPTLNVAADAILRAAPGLDAGQVAALSSGTPLTADGITADGGWVHVTSQQFAGWVRSEAFGGADALESLPKVKASALYPMQSFNFTTASSAVAGCETLPTAVLVLQAPPNTSVDVIANGVPVRFDNTIFLRTAPDGTVEIINVAGNVTVDAGEPSQTTFRSAAAAAARLNAGRVNADYRILDRAELESLSVLESLPENLLYSVVTVPTVLQVSPVCCTPPIDPDGDPVDDPETPTPFPRPPLDPGTGGDDLPGEFTTFTVGGEICPTYIIFHTDRTGTWEVFRTNIAGDGDVNLSQNDDDDNSSVSIQPSRSPDGEWVAFATNRDDGNWEIYISDIDGTETRRMTFNTGVDINPVWSNGSRIVFESNRDANWELYLFDVATGELRRLTDYADGADVDAEWSPDDQSIVFSRDVGGDYELFLIDVETGEETQLTDNNVDDIGASFNNDPANPKVAWLQRDPVSGIFNLIVRDLTTGEEEVMVDLGTDVNLASWSVDDSYIMFESNVAGNFDVFAVEVETGDVKNVSNSPFQDRAPVNYCSSNNILYQSDAASTNGNFDIFQVNPQPLEPNGPFNAPQQITNEPENEIYAVNSPVDEDASREGRLP